MTITPSATAGKPWAARVLHGPPGDPRWARPALLVLLAGTAVLYLWGLGASGWANAFYSAAAQAGATSWKAMFFGASDAAGAITVDKTPAALWPMALSARLFGVNSWSILVPQALMGVATVAALHATVRRSMTGAVGPAAAAAAGLLAGAVLALTPVATLMFRFNNPDALLVLMLTLGAYAVVRAQERGSGGWLALAAVCVGTGFLAKMLQAFLVLPVFALVYPATAPGPLRRRLAHALAAGVALVVSAGWWVAVVAVWPADARPYIGGSQHNSVLELALGYNGLGRLTGEEVGGLGNLDQDAGWARLLGSEPAGQAAWLLPAALILMVAGLWLTRRAARTDPARAGLVLWGGWLLVTALVFSFMRGIFHAYYTVALAPAVGALTGMGALLLWRHRRHPAAAVALALTTGASGWWAFVLLGRTPDRWSWLGPAVLAAGCGAAVLIVAGVGWPRIGVVAAGTALAALLAGPAAYAAETAATPHSGAIPSAGPSAGLRPGHGMGGGPAGPRPGGAPGAPGGPGGATGAGPQGPGNGARPALPPSSGQGGQAGPGGGAGQGRPGGGPGSGAGPGGLLGAATPSAALTALLRKDSGAFTWVAAAVGSNNAAGLQLAAGAPVMAVGGFNGTDPAPTLERFQRFVAARKIHYFVGTGMTMRSASGSDESRRIAAWVQAHFTARTVGGTTLYDLTAATG